MARKHDNVYELYAHQSPRSPIAEAYRTLRTNLGFAGLEQSYRSILISSVNPQDGKSVVASNLAVVLAQTGKKVILVDCDLRKPVLHKIFAIGNEQGLTNYLMQDIAIEEAAQKEVIENLTIMSSGPIPPNPAEMLESEKIRAMWPILLQKYDYVIVDGPPILAVADASILASQVEGVILVVYSGDTRINLAREAKAQLQKAQAKLIGVVLNKVKMTRKEYQYYYYYGSDQDQPDNKQQPPIKF